MITAEVKPLPVSTKKEDQDLLYRELELQMQRLGHLVPFREELNWENEIGTVEIGSETIITKLKKAAAKSDGVLLLYAKLTKGTVYQHIIMHPNVEGFYLPFRFEEPFFITVKNKKIWIGSSIRLAEELNWLEITMRNHDQQEVVECWSALKALCELSTEHNSPIILKKLG
ncbi:hypothetical protein QUF84_13530 [Fictibacillus enclensis]|uniref:Uncharacterized protein n=1 Tax=Fictibacillus enclensis TaxID=1017270 RepID=A0A0V8JE74_9BACL|nr:MULTISPECIES: hypothetical protein [Fictibacillus]KSU85228.1 hypothetical protein AS030_06865 [Fictibacillus enclensis]MDM5338242.1 hypothetical protein [Fictibacillus enclensis]RXY99105.1 hypothetical protein DMO16_05150 [Fictibacillus sp. S7]WHY74616.1 hypothetical protein QNH15_12205 [Fictibacillus enclensis]SCB93229.1 hypothetical protein GA0061096_1443 [Fictibacillus enclensis]